MWETIRVVARRCRANVLMREIRRVLRAVFSWSGVWEVGAGEAGVLWLRRV